jgi:hypothetical protein
MRVEGRVCNSAAGLCMAGSEPACRSVLSLYCMHCYCSYGKCEASCCRQAM